MNARQHELDKAIEFVRNTFAERRISLDYSTESVKHLDHLFDQEFKNGRLKNPDGGFAKFQGLIMIGISGYLAGVILKNAVTARLYIDEADKNWFINFKITNDDNRVVYPGQQVLNRVQFGEQASLKQFVPAAIAYFNGLISEMPRSAPLHEQPLQKKPWWKFGR